MLLLRRIAVAIMCCVLVQAGTGKVCKRAVRSGAETKPEDVAPTKCRCRFYMFDINAYLIHAYTSRQIRERTLEGLGGKRFVRLPENGVILNRWVRLVLTGAIQREQCILCGHKHRDHLEFWSWLDRKKTKAFDDCVNLDKCRAGQLSFVGRYIEPAKTVATTRRGKSKGQDDADDEVELRFVETLKQLPQYKPKNGSNILDRSLHVLSIATCLFRLGNLFYSEQESLG